MDIFCSSVGMTEQCNLVQSSGIVVWKNKGQRKDFLYLATKFCAVSVNSDQIIGII